MNEWRKWAEKIKKAWEVLDETDYYTVLSVPRGADEQQIRRAYYTRALQLHPDRVRNFPEPTRSQAQAIFKRVAEAYRILIDPEMRAVYDKQLDEGKTRLVVVDRLSIKPKSDVDMIKSQTARRYYVDAKKAFEEGNISRAKLNIKLAMQYEPSSEIIIKLKNEIEGG